MKRMLSNTGTISKNIYLNYFESFAQQTFEISDTYGTYKKPKPRMKYFIFKDFFFKFQNNKNVK